MQLLVLSSLFHRQLPPPSLLSRLVVFRPQGKGGRQTRDKNIKRNRNNVLQSLQARKWTIESHCEDLSGSVCVNAGAVTLATRSQRKRRQWPTRCRPLRSTAKSRLPRRVTRSVWRRSHVPKSRRDTTTIVALAARGVDVPFLPEKARALPERSLPSSRRGAGVGVSSESGGVLRGAPLASLGISARPRFQNSHARVRSSGAPAAGDASPGR